MCLGCNPEYHNKKLAKVKAKVNAVKISQSSKPRLKLIFLENNLRIKKFVSTNYKPTKTDCKQPPKWSKLCQILKHFLNSILYICIPR